MKSSGGARWGARWGAWRWPRWWPLGSLAAIALLLGLHHWLAPTPQSKLQLVAADADDPIGNRAYRTTVHLPRGGPYIFGFVSQGGAVMKVGNVTIRGQGSGRERLILDAGQTEVRISARGAFRLLWSPPGRRGDLEYLPASSMSLAPVGMAHFGADAGTNVATGVCALLIALVIVASVLVATRRRLAQVDKATWQAFAAVVAVGLLVRLIDLGGAGQTWDEDVNWVAGRNYISNLMTLDGSVAAWQWNFEHPPVMKYLVGIGAQFSDGMGPARLVSALVVALACGLLLFVLRLMVSLRVASLASLVATLTPALLAHGKVVGHEAPTLLWWVLALLCAVTAFDGLDVATLSSGSTKQRWLRLAARLVPVGIALGLAVASRFVNILAAPLLGVTLLLVAPRTLRRQVALLGICVVPLVAFATLVLVWPRLWHGPIDGLVASWQKLKKPHSPEPFLGVMTNVPPRWYFVVFLAATAPFGVLLAGVAGVVGLPFAGHKVERLQPPTAHPAAAYRGVILALLFAAPLLAAISPVRQDGVRYVMPSVLALSVAAALGVALLPKRVFPVAATALVVYLGVTAWRVHPYYLDYFGEHVGGPATVAQRKWFETAWWGEGLNAGVGFVNQNAAPSAKVYRDCIEPVHLAWFRGDLWRPMVTSPSAADWIVWYSPSIRGCHIPPGFTLRFEQAVQGAPLVRVYQRQRQP